MYQLILQENLAEVISYQDPAFMLRAYRGNLDEYVNHSVPAHWHSEVEIIYLLEGTAAYHVNAQKFLLHPGDALLVNSNRLHYGYSPENSNFVYSILQFRPEFVDSRPIRQNYLNRLIGDSGTDAALIRPEGQNQSAFLDNLAELIRLNLEQPGDYQLDTMADFYRLLKQMTQLGLIRDIPAADRGTPRLPALQNMLTYIQDHYAEPIRLADIAAAGAMCRSKCCSLFREVLQQSPLEFTQNFRIQKSIALLRDTDLSVSEIAEACGFNNASYYVECFHRIVGQSPKKYKTMLRSGSRE